MRPSKTHLGKAAPVQIKVDRHVGHKAVGRQKAVKLKRRAERSSNAWVNEGICFFAGLVTERTAEGTCENPVICELQSTSTSQREQGKYETISALRIKVIDASGKEGGGGVQSATPVHAAHMQQARAAVSSPGSARGEVHLRCTLSVV